MIAAGFAAGLRELGWSEVQAYAPKASQATARPSGRPISVVLVANRRGELPPPPDVEHVQTIVVGGRCAAKSVLAVVDTDVIGIVDGDEPFESQVRAVDRVLGAAPPDVDLDVRIATVRRQVDEADRLRRLTRREQGVLEALEAGLSAAEIAAADVVALTTVRAHIRAILAKLGVQSQLAAVALAHRAGCAEGSKMSSKLTIGAPESSEHAQ